LKAAGSTPAMRMVDNEAVEKVLGA
jgi:hypothetical protein